MPVFNPYLIEFSYPKNLKMLNSIRKTLLKVQPHYSHSSCESATTSRGTSASASYKQHPPPLLVDFTAKTNCSHFILTGFMIGVTSSLKTRISYCLLFMNIAYYLSIVNVQYRRYRRMYESGFLVNSCTGLHNANSPLFFILSYHSTWFHYTLRFCFLSLFSFCLFLSV